MTDEAKNITFYIIYVKVSSVGLKVLLYPNCVFSMNRPWKLVLSYPKYK